MICEGCKKDLCINSSGKCVYCGYSAPKDISDITKWVNEKLDEDFTDE